VRLVRAYAVLGEHDSALGAAANARRALAGDPDKVRRLDDQLKELVSSAGVVGIEGGR
jgi:cytochrome c-type biogenesis protein CcmH